LGPVESLELRRFDSSFFVDAMILSPYSFRILISFLLFWFDWFFCECRTEILTNRAR